MRDAAAGSPPAESGGFVNARALHLLLPGLRWPDTRDAQPYDGLRLPALSRLLGRGACRPLAATTPELWLAGQYGYATGAPFAALAALGAGLDPAGGCWMCADPAHVRPQGAELFLSAGRHLDIDTAEATACVAALEAFFAEDGMRFRRLAVDRWIASATDATAFETAPPSLAHGRSVDALLPTGPDARLWRRRLNESQMVLHPLPLNAAREALGRPTINSLWFWGAGVFSRPPARPFVAVHADPLEARGMALASGAATGPAPTEISDSLAAAREGPVLCWVDAGVDAAALGDIDGWRTALEAADQRLIAPAVRALREQQIDVLEVLVPAGRGGFSLTVTRGTLRRFWRRPRPLGAVEG